MTVCRLANLLAARRLWLHEACRQFRDRLVDEPDRAWFNTLLRDKLRSHLHLDWAESEFQDLVFGDFLERAQKPYQPVYHSTEKLAAVFDE